MHDKNNCKCFIYLLVIGDSYTVQAIINLPMKVLKAINIIQRIGYQSANGNCL